MIRVNGSSSIARVTAIVVSVFFGQVLPAVAEAQAPSDEQTELLRNMSPEQQQAILESLGKNGTTSRSRADRPLDFPPTVRPRERPRADDEDAEERPLAEPRLRGNDTVLLSLELRQLKRRPPELEDKERREQQLRRQEMAPIAPVTPVQPNTSTRPAPETQPPQSLERTDEETRTLEDFRQRVLRRNPYKLSKLGILNMPELGPIPLAGLTVEEATERLEAEMELEDFVVRVTRLPLKPTGTEALKPFGYSLFAGAPSTFAPATDVPVPAEYVIGPGDTLEVQLIGDKKGGYSLVVQRDGRINFPELGPIAVGGRRFEDVRNELESRVRQQMIGTQASIGIGELRSIRVFVLGDAEMPGSYTVSGLSTITNALFVSGGINTIGSLRNIQLKRHGATVTTLDLYDLLLHGDSTADVRLLPGDVIFVPPVGMTVGLAGSVRRPAIYELKTESTAADLLRLGGGAMPDADPELATLERVSERRTRITVDVNLASAAGQNERLRSGDVLQVPAIRPSLEDSVVLSGHVYRPGEYQFKPGMRIADVIRSLDELKPNADQGYALVRREIPPTRRIQVVSTDLERALSEPDSTANFALAPRDQIYVFDLESGRGRVIKTLIRELRIQSRIDEPTPEINVAGHIKIPGIYPFETGMRVADLLRAGGGLDEAAFGGSAELTRYEVVNGESRQVGLIEIDLRKALDGDPEANIALRPSDYLVIKKLPLWTNREAVEIRGEVKFPGRYPIHRGETLRSVMARAGGLTSFAFAEGAVFARLELKEREKKQMQTLATRMEADLAQLSLMTAQETDKDAGQALTVGQSLLASLRNTPPVGRLVVNLDQAMRAKPGSEQDIVLKDGDNLVVPRVTQEVTVIGEVQSATSHLYRARLSRDDYIAMSGGLTPRADDDRVYIVRADGSVVVRPGKAWFSDNAVGIKAGDTIVAPLDTERMRPLPFWTAVTTLVYNLAISVAALNSFN